MAHSHRPGGPICDLSTKKACDDRFADWQAMQQVILAYNIVRRDEALKFRGEKSAFAQLVLYIAGERAEMTNDDGNASQAPWVVRLRAAIERFIAGDIPTYNLYAPIGV